MSSNLYIQNPETSGIMIFDTSTYIDLGANTDTILGEMDLDFKLWLDKDSSFFNQGFQIFPASTGTIFRATVFESSLYISSYSSFNRAIDLSGLDGQVLNCKFRKPESISDPPEFYINGEQAEVVSSSLSCTGSNSGNFFGQGCFNLSGAGISGLKRLESVSMWDITITEVSTGTLIHSWKGYPDGNTDSGWVDQAGSKNGTILSASGWVPSTRNIAGTGEPGISFTKRLNIDPSEEYGPQKLYLSGNFIETPLMTFVTDGSEFDPAVGIVGGGILEWDMGDGSIINANSFTHQFSEEGDKEVKMYSGTTLGKDAIDFFNIPGDRIKGNYDFSDFTSCRSIVMSDQPITSVILPSSSPDPFNFTFDDCSIVGTFDLSHLSNFRGALNLSRNIGLQSVLIPDSSGDISSFSVDYCDITGTLDISALTGLRGQVRINDNPNLTQVLHPITSDAGGDLTFYNIRQCDITGTLDLRGFGDKFGGSITLDSNPNMTQILFPTSSANITQLYMYIGSSDTPGLTGTLDVSGLTNLGGSFRTDNNDNLTQILFPTSTRNFNQMILYRCNLTGTLDMSGLSGLGGLVLLYSNSNLTEVKFPTSSNSISTLSISQCDLTGTLDVSGLTNISGNIIVSDNPNLASILLPATSGNVGTFNATDTSLSTIDLSGLSGLHTIALRNITNMYSITWMTIDKEFNYVRADDCSLNITTVDNLFSIMNTWYSSNTPTSSLELTINGGTNSPPTDGSSNSDILNLESIFSGASQTLTININT